MSSVGLNGTVVQSGSRIFVSGSSSGIDTNALIDAAVQQRLREADLIDIRIDENLLRSQGYDQLQSLGANVQSSLDALRRSYGFSSTSASVYDQKTGTLSSNTATDPTSLLNVSIDETAASGTHTIVVREKAREHIITSDPIADPTAALGQNGSFRLRLPGQAQININVTGTDNLNDIAAKINAVTADTGVGAAVVKVNETNYKLVLTGQETGVNIRREGISGDNVLQAIGVLDGANAYKNTAQTSEKARLTYNGIDIARDDNSFDDLITGVNLDVLNADAGTTITLNIGQDNAGIKSAILDFVDSYNALRDFVLQNQVVNSDGTVPEDVLLANDNLLEQVDNQLQSLFGLNFNTGAQETLAEIGIEFDANNRLTVDELVLDTAIIDDPDVVRNIFQTQYSDDNAEFEILSNTSTQVSLNFALDITTDGTNITNVSVGGDNTLFTFSGGTIKGAVGSIYEGISFAYVGTASTTVNIAFDQGFADLASNTLEGLVNTVDGLIQQEKLAIESTNENLQSRADRVRERAEAYRISLIERYARFESQLNQANGLLNQIRAILGTNDDDN